jgi:hypothetical protein
MGEIGGSYNNKSEFYFDLMSSYGYSFDIFGSLYLRPELELSYKSNTGSFYGGLHASAVYGYDIGVESFSVFLYGGAGFGFNFFFSSTDSWGSNGKLVGNSFFGAKILFYGFGVYAEYRKNFLNDTGRLSVGLTFAIGNSYSPAPAPSIPQESPKINDNNRDRDYFSL